ncbi:hypothetical protein PQX77_020716 [Marasmius sp. AFHP31]|nr:hypothetical protein PQX77_020716 [Marasmius sp. AFHP31]
MSSQLFRNAQNFQIKGGNFSHVDGDQINYTTIVQAERKELTVLDEYYYVKRGAIYKLRENGRYSWGEDQWGYWIRRRGRADRISYAVEIVDRPGRVFTLVEYSGPEAKQAFENDFAMLISGLTLNGPQVYGYNLSAAPSILIYNELVPAAQVNTGFVGRMFLTTICQQLGCGAEEMWLDPRRGVFCRGLPGPTPWLIGWTFDNEELPLTAELIQEDVLLRFLAGLKSKHVDDVVVKGVAFLGASTLVPERVLRPTVISRLTNTPIAVANNSGWTSLHSSLSHRTLLADGMTRFTLAGGSILWLLWDLDLKEAWMAQAWNVFGARGISMEEDLCVYRLFFPYASLFGNLSDSEARLRSQQPIYLFVRPLPFDFDDGDTSSVHFWSSDENGHSPLSEDLCRIFGLPTTFSIGQFSQSYSWSNDAYNSLRQYQLLRGFDPSTTDFARSLGYDENIYQTLSDSDRFAQVSKEPALKDGASMSTAQISGLEEPTTSHPTRQPFKSPSPSTRRPSFWSTIFLPPSSEISGSSDTPAHTCDLDIEDID